MNGKVIPGTPIAVDFWKVRECPSVRLFFLTHLHGDHIVGLSSSWQHKIYCSEITGRLLEERFQIDRSLICPLETGSSHIVYMDCDQMEQMSVTVIDARHCPGSVMFLFEGYFGKVLYTGDFRFDSDMENDPLMEDLGKTDILYLDNTYNCPRCVFPTREHCMQQIIDIICRHDNHKIKIGMRSLGKEDLLVKIALDLKEWIRVSPAFFQLAEILDLPDVFITGETEARIEVVPFYSVSNKNIERWNQVHPTIALLPTSLYTGLDMNPFCNQENVFIVPYSDHSSFDELKEFVQLIKPSCISPIVSDDARGPFGLSLSDRADMSIFEPFLGDTLRKKSEIPFSVKRWMYGNKTSTSSKVLTKKPLALTKRRSLQKAKRGVHFDDTMEDFSESETKKKKVQEETFVFTEISNSQIGENTGKQYEAVDGNPSTTEKPEDNNEKGTDENREESLELLSSQTVSDTNKSREERADKSIENFNHGDKEDQMGACLPDGKKHLNVKKIHISKIQGNQAQRHPMKNFIHYVTETDSVDPSEENTQKNRQVCLTQRKNSPGDRRTDVGQPHSIHVIPVSFHKSHGKHGTERPHPGKHRTEKLHHSVHQLQRPLNVKPL